MDRVRFALLVPFMLVLVACESHPQTGAFAQSGRAVDEAGEGGAGGFAGAGAWGGVAGGDADLEGSDGYRVAIFAPATVLCPGECTELTARAMNGHGPYAYAWSE